MTVPSGRALINVGGQNDVVQSSIATQVTSKNPQSLFKSPYNGALYVLQATEGSASNGGDMTLQRYSGSNGSWSPDTHMNLNGFGHGVGFGIWYDPGAQVQHFFTECLVNTSSGRGTRINSFTFLSGATEQGSRGTVYDPNRGSAYSCAVDPTNSYLAIRFNAGSGFFKYQAFPLVAGAPNFSNPLIPNGGLSEYTPSGGYTFEGWTVAGRYLYTLTQRTSDKLGQIWSYDMNQTQNNQNGYISVANHGTPTATHGEFEGLAWGDSTYALYFMITDPHDNNQYTFNLHGIRG